MSAKAQAPSQTIRMGLIVPLTGDSADMSNSAPIGARVAVDEVNQVGGFLGRKLELIRDDQANNDVGLKHAQELVLNEKVAATIGFCNSGVAMKALDVFQTNKHLLREIRAVQRELERPRPPDNREAPWKHSSSH